MDSVINRDSDGMRHFSSCVIQHSSELSEILDDFSRACDSALDMMHDKTGKDAVSILLDIIEDIRSEMNRAVDLANRVTVSAKLIDESDSLLDATIVVASQQIINEEMIIDGAEKSDSQEFKSNNREKKDSASNNATGFYNLPISIIRSLIRNNYKRDKLPNKGGRWSGDRGNSNFIPNDDFIFIIKKRGQTISGRELKLRFAFDYISYHYGEPDFSQFADKRIGIIQLSSMPNKRTGSGGSYKLAAMSILHKFGSVSSVIQYMKKHDLSWHECSNGTIIAMPTIINSIFSHSAGIYISKGLLFISKILHQKTPSGIILIKTQSKKYYLKK